MRTTGLLIIGSVVLVYGVLWALAWWATREEANHDRRRAERLRAKDGRGR